MNVLSIILFCVLFVFSNVSRAELRNFTNKEGKTIEAEIFSVTPDWSEVVVLANNQKFPLSPVSLVLDDQQYIKDWLAERGSLEPDLKSGAQPIQSKGEKIDLEGVRIDVRSKVSNGSSVRVKDGYYDYESRPMTYNIEVLNLNSSTVNDLIVDYAVVINEKVGLPNKGYSSGLRAYKGKRRINSLIYNRKHSIVSRPLHLDTRSYDYAESDTADELQGLIVQIKTLEGKILHTYRDADGDRFELEWDKVEKLSSGTSVTIPYSGDFTLDLNRGDFVDKKIPVQGKALELSVFKVRPKPNTGGVIAEIGGDETGLSLYIKGQRLVLAARNAKSGVKSVETSLPLGEFDVIASLNSNGLSLIAGNSRPAILADIKGLNANPSEGITIGSAGGYPVDDYGSDGDFDGQIEKVTFKVSKSD